MAEARSEEDEENMRETREQVVRRQANSSGGRPDRRKPEHRHSQGPLSSIRAAIKRTSNRTTSLSETPPRERERDRERERERDRDRDRRRPEITILSAEPLSSTPWFPGAGFPPPPPPAAQIWGPTISPSVQEIQPPPSYEEVIREKTQEQVIVPSPSSRPPPLSPQLSVSKTTIATQTDTGAAQESAEPHVRRPLRPPRPSSKPFKPDNSALDQSPPPSLLSNGDAASSDSTQTPSCDLLPESSSSPLTSSGAPQTDQWDGVSASNSGVQQCPRPRPRSKINLQPIGNEVKVQTLVKLREDGLKTLAARARADDQASHREASGGKYLQELLEAFSSDDWGFPEQRSASQSESEDEETQEVNEEQEEEEDEDMATLRARIQAFEQMHDGSLGGETVEPCVPTKPRPEPKPRPRVQQNKPPMVAPKPKNITSPKPSCKGFWEDSGQSAVEPEEAKTNTKQQTEEVLLPQAVKSSEKPSVSPKPQINVETANANTAPVPAPRPCPPPAQPKLPPRPTVTPRASRGPAQDRGPSVGQTTPPLPPRPAVDIRTRAKTETANGEERNGNVKVGSSRPSVPSKPASLTSPRRASAPSLDSNRGPSPDPSPVPSKPIAQPPSRPGPAPALRKATSVQSSSDPPLPPRPTGVKLLPLRPPPIKSLPGRPPPPSTTSSSSNQTPSLKKSPSASSLQSDPTSVSTNQTQGQRASKKGPPLPPRPKPGHPLYNSYKQDVLIVLDDPSPAPSEPNSQSGDSTAPAPVSALLIDSTQCLLDLDSDLEPVLNQDQTKPALEGLSETQSILPVEPVEQKEQPEPATISGPRCVALFDYEAVEEDELTFSQGDIISLLELIGRDWGRGQLHKRTGIFPLNFTETVEPLPAAPPTGETNKTTPTETTNSENTGPPSSTQNQDSVTEEWAVAVYDFPGQAEEDLSFQKGALIRVLEHIDAEWRRGRVDDREGLYPAAFTQTTTAAQPITAQQSEVKAKALFNFTAENEDELTLKVGDILTQVEFVDEQWILGVVGGKRGIVPKNYISILS